MKGASIYDLSKPAEFSLENEEELGVLDFELGSAEGALLLRVGALQQPYYFILCKTISLYMNSIEGIGARSVSRPIAFNYTLGPVAFCNRVSQTHYVY